MMATKEGVVDDGLGQEEEGGGGVVTPVTTMDEEEGVEENNNNNNNNGRTSSTSNNRRRRPWFFVWLVSGAVLLVVAGLAIVLVEWKTTATTTSTSPMTTTTTNSDDYSTVQEETSTAAAAAEASTSTIKVRRTSIPPLTNSQLMLERLQQVRQDWIQNQLIDEEYGPEAYYDIFEPPLGEQRVNVGKHRAFVDPQRLPIPGQKYEDVVNAASTESLAWNRMVRKWTIKLLQIQLGMLEEEEEENLLVEDEVQKRSSGSFTNPNNQNNNKTYSKFVWANGGHSASAAHGNLYRESYTAVLGRDLQPALQQIGLDFQVRNYAMGGTHSGEEVALCFNSIFGKDVDSITWDYWMMDGSNYHYLILYAYNAARLAQIKPTPETTEGGSSSSSSHSIPHRPSLWALHTNGDQLTKVLQTIQNVGMTTLVMDDRFREDNMYPGFPDMLGITEEEIASIPTFARYFKCGDMIESGDPVCKDNKYNLTVCPTRNGRAPWHWGYRYHALVGHTMSMTIFEILQEALHNLIELELLAATGRPQRQEETPQERHQRLLTQLLQLDAEEQNDYNQMLEPSSLPEEFQTLFEQRLWNGDWKESNKDAMKELDVVDELVYKFSFCHTAILPSEIRYKGLLTGNSTATTGTVYDRESYEHGFLLSELLEAENPAAAGAEPIVFVNPYQGREQQMIIGSNDYEYENPPCEEELTQEDHHDFFFISSQQGWRTLTFPNEAEQQYYQEFDVETSKGWIFACLTNCMWGKCEPGDIRESIVDGSLNAGMEYGQIEMVINGVQVSDTKCLNRCCALRHEDPDPKRTSFHWAPNNDGRYDFQIRITDATAYSYVRFSSFIVA